MFLWRNKFQTLNIDASNCNWEHATISDLRLSLTADMDVFRNFNFLSSIDLNLYVARAPLACIIARSLGKAAVNAAWYKYAIQPKTEGSKEGTGSGTRRVDPSLAAANRYGDKIAEFKNVISPVIATHRQIEIC